MTERRVRLLGALREAAPSLSLIGDPKTPIVGVACNTEMGDVLPGVLFAPLDVPPPRVAAIAAEAVAHGAAALLVERRLDLATPQLIAPETRPALARIAANFYGYPGNDLGCIGVTGTDGKTTTTFLIDAILRAAGIPTGLIGSLAIRFGATEIRHQTFQTTPEAPYVQSWLRRMVDAGDTWAILEATSQGLAQHRLDDIPFSVGAITSITRDHLDFHGSVTAYRRAKAILFERVAEHGGAAVINADDPAAREMLSSVGSARVISYSATGRAVEVRATDVELGLMGTRFTLTVPEGTAHVALPLLGEFNVANALAAAAVARAVGIPLAGIARGLTTASPIPGLLARVDAGQPFSVLIDEAKSAFHTVNALEVARRLAGSNRVIVLVGGTTGTGREQARGKGQVAALVADYAVFTTQRTGVADPASLIKPIADGARAAGGRRGKTFTCIVDRRKAIRHALAAARPGDCVLLAGKGAENTIRVQDVFHDWDEAAIVREILVELGFGEIHGDATMR
jgi:UDP-N-acetylmuramoyl-L-alanyl-D-glutamate--2,6-diaminopimelate ligase